MSQIIYFKSVVDINSLSTDKSLFLFVQKVADNVGVTADTIGQKINQYAQRHIKEIEHTFTGNIVGIENISFAVTPISGTYTNRFNENMDIVATIDSVRLNCVHYSYNGQTIDMLLLNNDDNSISALSFNPNNDESLTLHFVPNAE
jgi:hypothetical protein